MKCYSKHDSAKAISKTTPPGPRDPGFLLCPPEHGSINKCAINLAHITDEPNATDISFWGCVCFRVLCGKWVVDGKMRICFDG